MKTKIEKPETVAIILPGKLVIKINKLADDVGRKRSDYLRRLIIAALGEKQ